MRDIVGILTDFTKFTVEVFTHEGSDSSDDALVKRDDEYLKGADFGIVALAGIAGGFVLLSGGAVAGASRAAGAGAQRSQYGAPGDR